MYKNLLNKLFENYEENREMIQYCYKLIAQTRDIIDGKGLYTLSYALLGEWVRLCYVENKANIENVNQALRYFVQNGDEHAFGSWTAPLFCSFFSSSNSRDAKLAPPNPLLSVGFPTRIRS